jgi:hypothetical protein
MIAHAMAAGLLPAGVIEAIDKRRRSFFWAGEESCNGGQCKVAWGDVCTPKNKGGLVILSIPAQNSALLSKFLIKLHSNSDAPWACWFRRRYGWSSQRDLGDPHFLDTPIWKNVVSGLASFRRISKVVIGNGVLTAFWHDLWLGPTALSDRFPALFSHFTRTNISVSLALLAGLRSYLVPRLTSAATQDIQALTLELGTVVLRTDILDSRTSLLANKPLSNKCFHANSFRELQVDELAGRFWRSAAPLKCKILCWLAWRRRLPTNERRFRHSTADSPACPLCPEDEDTDHLLFRCFRAREVWTFFGLDVASSDAACMAFFLWERCSSFEASTICTAIAWTIWKRRNAMIFNGVDEDLTSVARRCIQDIRLWAYRCTSTSSSPILNSWCLNFDPP